MKNTILFFALTISTLSLFAQGIPVSRTIEKKNVVLEEYTGIHCVNCPNGHKYAQQLLDAHPGHVVLINIHAGGYAVPNAGEPDFRTSAGEYIANQSGLTGYPSASVNRHVFPSYADTPGETAIVNRQYWIDAGNQILTQNSSANLGIEATVDIQSNLLTVHVQVYYTASPSSSTNRIHVALLQNNLESQQTGAQNNPDQVLPNGNYNHRYMLRAMLSGVSGKTINASVGGTVDEYFTYVIPADLKGVPVVLENLNVAAFLTETTQETVTGQVVKPTFTNFPSAINSKILGASLEPTCGFTVSPVAHFQNFGTNPLTSLYIDYSINGSPEKTFYWTGNLNSLQEQDVTLNGINFFPQSTNTLTINTRLPNGVQDGYPSDDEKDVTFSSAPDVDNSVTMTLQLDYWGSEVSWEVLNSSGTQLYNGGPYTNSASTSGPLPALITQNFTLTSGDCYKFVTHDAYQDGILGTGTGFSLQDANSQIIVVNYAAYGAGGDIPFGVDAPQPDSSDVFTGIMSAEFPGSISVFPNPTSGKINLNLSLEKSTDLNISVTNTLGRTVLALPEVTKSGNSQIQIDAAGLIPGIYFLNVKAGENYLTEKILITF